MMNHNMNMRERMRKEDPSYFVVKPGGAHFLLGIIGLVFDYFAFGWLLSPDIRLVGNTSLWIAVGIIILSVRSLLMAALDKTEIFSDGIRVKHFWQPTRFYSWSEIDRIKAYYSQNDASELKSVLEDKPIQRPQYPDSIVIICKGEKCVDININLCDYAEQLVNLLKEKGFEFETDEDELN